MLFEPVFGLFQQVVEDIARRVADAFSRPLDALQQSPPHTRSSTDDARIHLDAWVKQKPVAFGVLAAAAGGAAAVVVPTNLGIWTIPSRQWPLALARLPCRQ